MFIHINFFLYFAFNFSVFQIFLYSHRFFLYFPPNLACPSKSSVFVRVLAINFHMIRRKPWLSVRFFVGLLLKRLRSFSRLRSSRLSVNPFESEYLLLNVELFQTLSLVSLKTISLSV